jgi:regulator of telomere elongation helicase 1
LQVLDIEELTQLGKAHSLCPYYHSRNSMAEADIVFLPYNYLIDTTIRSSLTALNLDNAIVIFDEAHNLESVCGESASFDLTATDLSLCISEADRAIELAKDAPSGDYKSEDFAR